MRRLINARNFLRFYRLGVVVFLGWLVHTQAKWFERQQPPKIALEQAQKIFPKAARVEVQDAERGVHVALDERGETLGALLMTSPQTDHIIGYSGPNNVLVALDTNGAVAGLNLLRSGDTEEHVEMVLRDREFLRTFVGWRPGEPLKVSGVAGATLTSFAMAESVHQRLAGAAASLRFTEPLTIAEVRTIFTNAASFQPDGRRYRVHATNGSVLGFVLRTSPQADNVAGFRGPTDALVGLDPDGHTVTRVRVLRSYDTPSYVDQIRDDDYYLNLFRGRTIEDLAALDFKREKLEGVSGATETSYAIAEGLKRRAAAELQPASAVQRWWRTRDAGLALVIAGAFAMAFTPLRGKRWLRVAWQAVLVIYVGIINADLLSLALLGKWSAHGIALKATPGLLLLAAVALLTPTFTRRQLYCHQICPHGAAQQFIGSISRWRWTPPKRIDAWLEKLPASLLVFALVILLVNWRLNLAHLEAFDAWSWRAAAIGAVVLAAAGLVAALFIPQAYCRYACPTGALLNFVRSTGSGDRWSRRDTCAIFVVGLAIFISSAARMHSRPATASLGTTMTGRTMGTTWTVKIRGSRDDAAQLQSAIAAKFDSCEQLTSHWRTNTDVARFNFARTTNAIPVPQPLADLVRASADISRASGGAFDITIGPLVQLWGFGPAPRRTDPPRNDEIAAVLERVGWTNVHAAGGTLQKNFTATELDLSAIVPGWAIDEVAALLEARGVTEFLIESGGELRARGSWPIAIEHPTRGVTLRDESIGTSGTYRQNWKAGGKRFSHLIDPRTGSPIAHNTVSVSVRHASCAQADAWAAALNVLGTERGRPLAETLSLAAQFVVEHEDGSLELLTTSAWINSSTRSLTLR
jgi:NosR/NirI family transcriptional regulator, nitrous oxide reductase regulator